MARFDDGGCTCMIWKETMEATRSGPDAGWYLENCSTKRRLYKHGMEVYEIKQCCSKYVKLRVGPEKAKTYCLKAALGYYSEFFDETFFGSVEDGKKKTFRMPEDDPEAIKSFVPFVESGQAYSKLSLEELWALGQRLQTVAFTNEIMHMIFRREDSGEDYLEAENANNAYALTLPGSKLREYYKQLILTGGPLSRENVENSTENDYPDEEGLQKWTELIERGGELVDDIVVNEGGTFSRPFHWEKQDQYLESVTTRPLSDFLEGKPRSGTR